MILLDTNVLSELMCLEPDESVVKNINHYPPANVFTDAQISAIALQHDLQLFTRNVKDFEKIDNLRVVNPWIA